MFLFENKEALAPYGVSVDINIILLGFAADSTEHLLFDGDELQSLLNTQSVFPQRSHETGEIVYPKTRVNFNVLQDVDVSLNDLEELIRTNLVASEDDNAACAYNVDISSIEEGFDRYYENILDLDEDEARTREYPTHGNNPYALFLINPLLTRLLQDVPNPSGQSIEDLIFDIYGEHEAMYCYRHHQVASLSLSLSFSSLR